MRSLAIRSTICALVVWGDCAAGKVWAGDDAAAAAQADSPAIALEPLHEITGTLVQYYRPIQIKLTETPAEELTKQPEYAAKKPLYGTMKLGSGADDTITVVVDEVEGGEPRIYIDRNNDEDLTNDGTGEWTRTGGPNLGLSKVRIDVPYESGEMPYEFEFYRFKERLRDTVLYYRNSGRQGALVSGGKSYKIAVLDENADGRFDDLKEGTFIIDLDGDGKLVGSTDSAEYHQLAEPFNVHGQVWEVASLSADGTALRLRPSDAKVEMKRYLEPGFQALTFAATDLHEQPLRLDDERAGSKYVLLDFWASWCGPCRKEFPRLRRLIARYKDHGLRVIGVNLDEERDAAVKAVADENLDYRQVYDGLGWKNSVALLYRVDGIPQTYLLDSDLKIVAKGVRGAALERRLEELLGEGDPAFRIPEYQPVAGWPTLPPTLKLGPVSAVAAGAAGNVFLLQRAEPPVLVLDRTGKFVRSWGEGQLKNPHGLRTDREGHVWLTDTGRHVVQKFDAEGKLLMTLGKADQPGDGPDQFNKPADVAIAASGEIYVADGYGNSRIVKFSKEGDFIKTWGTKGSGAGEFNLPHAVCLDGKGRVYVGDRENNRVQVFDAEGTFVAEWKESGAPYGLFLHDDRLYVADGRAQAIVVLDLEGKPLGRWSTGEDEANAPHWVSLDRDGNVYLAYVGGQRVEKLIPK